MALSTQSVQQGLHDPIAEGRADFARGPGAAGDAYRWCQRYTREHGENFTVVSWFLPRHLRRYMFAVYAACRFTDDLGDEAEGGPQRRLELLDEWESELRHAVDGRAQHPIAAAVADTARETPLTLQPFLRLIDANRLDQRQSRYQTFQDLLDYCDLSANCVGEMVLAVWGFDDDYRIGLSDATCTALQLANHWQDVRRDFLAQTSADSGRLYLPLEDLRQFGLSEDDIAAQIQAGRADANTRELIRFQVDRAEAYFRRGERLIDEVPRDLAVDLRLFSDGGRAVLDAIAAQDYDVLGRRPRVGKGRRAWLALRAAAALKLG